MRFYHALFILAIVAGVSWTSPTLHQGATARAQSHIHADPQHSGRYDSQAPGGQLYVREETVDSKKGRAETAEEAAFRKRFPELYATEAVIVNFTATWCQYCKPQKRRLVARQGQYNMVIFDVDETRGKELSKRWGILTLPTTVIVEKGKVVKAFIGLTTWEAIRSHAEKARKDEKQKTTIQVFPFIRIDVDGGRPVEPDRTRRRS